MADSARPMTPPLTPAGTPRGMSEAAAGAAAARPFVQRLRASGDEGEVILELVKEAEEVHENLYALSEIYGVAVEVYAKTRNAEDYDLSDLSVKRMRVLCRLNPAEAREFHNRLRAYNTGRADARMYEARAGMEARLGDTAKAVKMLQEGLRVGAQPEEALRRQLKRFQPTEPQQQPAASGALTPQRGTTSRTSTGHVAGPTPPRSPRPPPTPTVKPPLPQKLAAAATPPQKPAAATVTPSAMEAGAVVPASGLPAKPAAQAAMSTLRPRSLLGLLGPPTRVLDGDNDDDDDDEEKEAAEDVLNVADGEEDEAEEQTEDENEEEDEDEEVHSCEDEDESDDNDNRTDCLSTAMCPLSPIQEVESLEEATCESGPCTGASIPPPGSTTPARTPRRETFTPRRSAQHDLSIDSGTPSIVHAEQKSQPSGSGKLFVVNGITYSTIRKIGSGGSSKVYRVLTPEGEEVALKRVATDCPKQFEGYANEVDLLLRLRGHEHVIQVLDAELDRENGRIFIVMEAGDTDFNSYLKSEPRLSLAKLQSIWRQMLSGLQVIHKDRIVHSDLKPGNFVLVRGTLKVIDFGIASRISNDTTNICRETLHGTLSYIAPECLKNCSKPVKVGRASDIWSLGIILYQMVYNQLPLAHLEPIQRCMQLGRGVELEFPDDHCLDQHSSTTKAQLLEVLGGCLQLDPRRRPSLDYLLAHPFLRTSAAVQRQAVEDTVASVMGSVVRLVGDASQAPDSEVDHPGQWQMLADEVWERVSGTRSSSTSSATGGFDGLATVSALATHVSTIRGERDSALAEAARQKARNAELEEQLRHLQQRGPAEHQSKGYATCNEIKDKGLPRWNQKQGLEDKENNPRYIARSGVGHAAEDMRQRELRTTAR